MRDKLFRKGLAAGIIALLISISLMPIAGSLSFKKYVLIASPYGIDLFCDEPYKNVKQGDIALFVVEITNIGTFDDTYEVIAGSIEDIVCKVNGVNADQFNPYEFTLISGKSTTFEVTAEVWESVPIGEWNVMIEARSQNNSEVYDELTLTANVRKKNRVMSESENDCGCQVVNSRNLVKVEMLLVSLEVYLNIVLLRFGHIPEVQEKSCEILDVINSDGFWDDFCNSIVNIMETIQDLIENYGGIYKLLTPVFAVLLSLWFWFCWLR